MHISALALLGPKGVDAIRYQRVRMALTIAKVLTNFWYAQYFVITLSACFIPGVPNASSKLMTQNKDDPIIPTCK